MISLKAEYLAGSVLKMDGVMDRAVRFVLAKQLLNERLWDECTEVYGTKDDGEDGMWRGEFFGKLMRGATFVYTLTKDGELYDLLTRAVQNLLDKQEEDGRLSTYSRETEFNGWDMWCRKYSLTGLVHYYEICKDGALRKRVLSALEKSLDYIVAHIGDGEGQKSILETSGWWGCTNSCSILEPTVAIYKLTGKKSFLEFAQYIIGTGGSSECDFAELALKGELLPYQYPVVKAYETMSYFEGLLSYYEVTGERKYYDAVINFVKAVNESDMTVIGCCGCSFEMFDNSSVKQTEYSDTIMQETCVTVTWMRLLARLYVQTGNPACIDAIERSGFNALYGSLNTSWLKQLNLFTKELFGPMVFDSYSPLYKNKRGSGIGGFLKFSDGGYCGCCVAIGACGVALMPLLAVTQRRGEAFVNVFCNGKFEVEDADGKRVVLETVSNYPSDGKVKIKISCQESCNLTISVRKPAWCRKMTVNGAEADGGYFKIEGPFLDGDEIEADAAMELERINLNGKVAFTYGPLTLAADVRKTEKRKLPSVTGDVAEYELAERARDELVRIACTLTDGEKLLLTDYQSCGKNWTQKNSALSVWLDMAV